LPPREEWVEIRSKLQPGIALEIECLWKWVGISLDAFFSNLSDPVPHSGLNKIMQCEVQSTSIPIFIAINPDFSSRAFD
jgi:hypothetical protein